MSQTDELYPLSTENGQAIPLDVVRPTRLWFTRLTPNAVTYLDLYVALQDTTELLSLYSNVDVMLGLDISLTYPVGLLSDIAGALFLPANTVYTVAANSIGSMSIVPLEAAIPTSSYLSVQLVTRWAGIALPRQLTLR